MKLSRKTNFGRLSWLMVARLSLTCNPFVKRAGETGEEDRGEIPLDKFQYAVIVIVVG